jgi:glycosyltransferase involved in cell wall biosynthesis
MPVVAYRAGGPADLVRHGVDGMLATCGDVAELATRMRELTTDTAFRGRLGAAGQARVATEFRWPDKLNLVREVLARLTTRS